MSKIRIINEKGTEGIAEVFSTYDNAQKVDVIFADGVIATVIRTKSKDEIPTFRLKKPRKKK